MIKDGFIHRTLSFRPAEDALLNTLADFEDRSKSAVVRRLIEAEVQVRHPEIEVWKRTQAKKKSAA